MHENPYESPRTPDSPAPRGGDPIGIWRDGDLLVMRIRDARFPPRCVKTDEPFSGAPTRLDVDWIPNHGLWLLMLGALGHAIAKSAFGKSISVELPLSREWRSRQARTAVIGWTMIIGGIAGLVLGTVGYVLARASGMDDASTQWIMVLVLVAPLVALAGAISMFALHRPIVTCRRMTAAYAWIDGIDKRFLESLPEWTT